MFAVRRTIAGICAICGQLLQLLSAKNGACLCSKARRHVTGHPRNRRNRRMLLLLVGSQLPGVGLSVSIASVTTLVISSWLGA